MIVSLESRFVASSKICGTVLISPVLFKNFRYRLNAVLLRFLELALGMKSDKANNPTSKKLLRLSEMVQSSR